MRLFAPSLALLALPFLAFAQIEKPASEPTAAKSATPLSPAHSLARSPATTRAVVVGISDYQDAAIPDLRFAHRDAEAFANFLRSPAGGALDGDHLKVLTNQNATQAQFAIALDWLMENSNQGDQAIIYFSGHGDVEKKSLNQPGYLLCWDAPARVYLAGGALALPMFQEVISTLSVQNKAKVVVITDACHSGKLSGSAINGAQLTGANLAQQAANEVKILSCQPDEYSIEGEQWGGGRGAFSFNLVEALYGLADANNDLSVNLKEVGRYLEDHVSVEVAPVPQNPKVIGSPTERLANVDTKLLADLRSGKTNQQLMLSPVASRGMEDELLAGVDTTVRELYHLFKMALKDKVFLEPATACADTYYERLLAEPKLQRLHSTMTRNYAAALQDDAQQTLNAWLKTSQDASLEAVDTKRLPQKVFTEKVRLYPRCLDRAAELLGEKHYMHAALKARKYFFEGYLLANSNRNPNREFGERALALFRQSLEWQPEQPQVFWQMCKVYGYNLRQPDSLEYYARLALEVHPNWTRPCTDAAFWLSHKYKQQDRARPFLEQASRIDSSSAEVLHSWAIFYFDEKNYEKAEMVMKKGLALNSTDVSAWNNLGQLYIETRNYADAEPVFKKAIALDSTNAGSWNKLGYLYLIARDYAEAEPVMKKGLALDSTVFTAWNNLGQLYTDTRRYAEAEPVFKKAIALDSTLAIAWSNLGLLYLDTHHFAEAEEVFKKVIALDSTHSSALSNLGWLYIHTHRYSEAEPVLKKAIVLKSTFANPRKHLGMVYFKTNRPEEARQNFLQAIALNPNYAGAMLGMAYLLAAEGKTEEAIGYVEQAIGKKATFEQLEADEDLVPLRALPEWKVLMKKYFPDKVKD